MEIKLINKSNHPNPEYKTTGSSGMDICASILDSITIKPGERLAVPTSLFLEIPIGFEAQIRPRSGLALKKGVTILNSPGTIDSDYRGEVKVILVNHSNEPFSINDGDRIAQIVIAQVEKVTWKNKSQLASSKRGLGGFGSTGKN